MYVSLLDQVDVYEPDMEIDGQVAKNISVH